MNKEDTKSDKPEGAVEDHSAIQAEAEAFFAAKGKPPQDTAIPAEKAEGEAPTDSPKSEPPAVDLDAIRKELEEEKKRRAEAQRVFHEGRAERARLAKELEELKAQVGGLKSNLDSQKPDPAKAKVEEAFKSLEVISPETVEVLKHFQTTAFSPEKVEQLVKEKLVEERKKLAEEAESYVKGQQWKEGVLKEVPEYFTLRDSPEFKDWYRTNQLTVDSLLSQYDNLDPVGGITMMKRFMEATGRKPSQSSSSTSSDAASRKAEIAATPTGKRPAAPTKVDPNDEEAATKDAIEWALARRKRLMAT